jgi:hypothetical protein
MEGDVEGLYSRYKHSLGINLFLQDEQRCSPQYFYDRLPLNRYEKRFKYLLEAEDQNQFHEMFGQ